MYLIKSSGQLFLTLFGLLLYFFIFSSFNEKFNEKNREMVKEEIIKNFPYIVLANNKIENQVQFITFQVPSHLLGKWKPYMASPPLPTFSSGLTFWHLFFPPIQTSIRIYRSNNPWILYREMQITKQVSERQMQYDNTEIIWEWNQVFLVVETRTATCSTSLVSAAMISMGLLNKGFMTSAPKWLANIGSCIALIAFASFWALVGLS